MHVYPLEFIEMKMVIRQLATEPVKGVRRVPRTRLNLGVHSLNGYPDKIQQRLIYLRSPI
jgi:hypothetical protein